MILISPQAEEDLVDIWLYIAADSPDNADRFLDYIYQQARHLAELPQSGKLRPELAPDLRSFPVAKYLLFYREQNSNIELVRVLHAARDLDTFF
ncbi:MAG: type II toxin-antitoxin system RelE/ParE family toxin [Cellvibrio sp.]